MAKEPAPEQSNAEETAGGNPMIRIAIIVVAVLILELATVGITVWLSTKPAPTEEDLARANMKKTPRLVDIKAVEGQFPNTKESESQPRIYDAVIWVVVKEDPEVDTSIADKKQLIEDRKGEFTAAVSQIVAQAEPRDLRGKAPKVAEQILKAFNKIVDPDGIQALAGKPPFEKVVISHLIPYRMD